MELQIPGCDEGTKYQISRDLEIRRAKLSRGKDRARAREGGPSVNEFGDHQI